MKMSQNYNFKHQPKLPSSEDIARHRNFDELLKRYRATSATKPRTARLRRLVYVSISAAAAVILALIGLRIAIQPQVNQSPMSSRAYFAQQAFSAPPVEGIAAPAFANFRLDAAQGGAQAYSQGSKLVVPAYAFADDYGRLVEGEVDVYYREMHDYVDFFMAGTPMAYDSAGQVYQLESAGMIELYAEQNGQPVRLAVGKKIDIELISEISVPSNRLNVPPAYQVYYLDTLGKQWRYETIDNLAFLEGVRIPEDDPLYGQKQALMTKLQALEAQKAQQIAALESRIPEPVKPLRPEPAKGDLPTLELNFLDGSVAVEDTRGGQVQRELAQLQETYASLIWQISNDSPAYDERAFSVEWASARLRPIDNLNYELTLVHPQSQLTLIVSPVLLGEDYKRALERYSVALEAYWEQMEEREAKLSQERNAILQATEAEKNQLMADYEAGLQAANTPQTADRYLVRRKLVNRFQVDKLGVWNCARPSPIEGQPIQAAFKDQHGNRYANHTAYLVDKHKNTIYRFYSGGDAIPTSGADSEMLIWLVTPDNRLAVLRPEAARRLNAKPGQATLQLQLMEEPPRTEAEIRQVLAF